MSIKKATQEQSLNFKTKTADNALEQNHISDGSAPIKRMRRLRRSLGMRRLLSENEITKNDLIYPLFVEEGINERTAIQSLPGVEREAERTLPHKVEQIAKSDIPAIILFGVSKNKDAIGSDSLTKNGLLARMIRSAKDTAPEILVTADICLCEYTDHGHCGPIGHDGSPDNDRTLELIAQQAVIACDAGADIIAPSGMMDGMVAALRNAMDQNGFNDIPVLSYAAKFASAHYGPFRDAAGCSLGKYEHAQKDRKSYQMNPANYNEAMREVEIDINEGADMVMVKPGLPYLDVIKGVKDTFHLPTFAYHVSGEYAMLKAAAQNGWIDYDECMMEQMLSFKRAGADAILTYSAMDVAKILG